MRGTQQLRGWGCTGLAITAQTPKVSKLNFFSYLAKLHQFLAGILHPHHPLLRNQSASHLLVS